jgi:hypothetical protein
MALLQMIRTLFLRLEIELLRRSFALKAMKMNYIGVNITLTTIISSFGTVLRQLQILGNLLMLR